MNNNQEEEKQRCDTKIITAYKTYPAGTSLPWCVRPGLPSPRHMPSPPAAVSAAVMPAGYDEPEARRHHQGGGKRRNGGNCKFFVLLTLLERGRRDERARNRRGDLRCDSMIFFWKKKKYHICCYSVVVEKVVQIGPSSFPSRSFFCFYMLTPAVVRLLQEHLLHMYSSSTAVYTSNTCGNMWR